MASFLVPAMIAGVDLISKKIVRKNLREGERKELIKDKFYFWRVKNTGAAFNMLEENPKAVLVISGVISGIIGGLFMFHRKDPGERLRAVALALCLGGAAGNLIDRISQKGVTDFIYIKKGKLPIFNVADASIFIGGAILVLSALFKKE